MEEKKILKCDDCEYTRISFGCERCWGDASMGLPSKAEKYNRLIKEREDNPCSIEDQIGLYLDDGCDYRCKRANDKRTKNENPT